jgi:hypothetical protein
LHAGLRWLAAVAVGVVVFEGLDLVGSSPFVLNWIPAAASLPTVSPFLCGAAAAGVVRQHAAAALLAAAAAVWARIGVDTAIGMLQGAHPSGESDAVLLFYFGLPWMLNALAGGVGAVLVRGAVRLRHSARRRGSAPPA